MHRPLFYFFLYIICGAGNLGSLAMPKRRPLVLSSYCACCMQTHPLLYMRPYRRNKILQTRAGHYLHEYSQLRKNCAWIDRIYKTTYLLHVQNRFGGLNNGIRVFQIE